MPRRRRSERRQPHIPLDVERLSFGIARTEVRRGIEWRIQPVSAAKAVKEYTCPGCGGTVVPGTAHLVAWRADSIMGEASALADRRHWHSKCWQTS